MSEVLVVGSGVIGLTTAITLLERGHAVRVVAREFAWRTTSAVAAAIWFPYEARPAERVNAWAAASYRVFAALARQAGTGVTMTEGVIYARANTATRWWRDLVPAWRAAPASELPAGVVAGDVVVVPVAEMPIHLQFLVGQVQQLGGRLELGEVSSLDHLDARVVVNCSGLGARALVRDATVYPIRGQVVCTERVVDRFVIDDDNEGGVTYIVPRSGDCVLGGTAQANDADLRVREAETDAIRARCAGLRPCLAGAATRAVKVGLRPGRAMVRLEREPLAGGRMVIHNYGHGGAGMTLSWGCAQEVAHLLIAPN
jgi:D-amino-acid oxidase